MRFVGSIDDARISGLAEGLRPAMFRKDALSGLSGANAMMVYGRQSTIVGEVLKAPWPSAIGTRPPDALIFSDPYQYLGICLNQSDWEGVARWYATQLTKILETSTRPPDFWNISKLNLQTYCNRTFTLSDLRAFTELCILKMCVADYGNKVGFGYQGPRDTLNLAMFFSNGLSDSNGQLDWFKSYDAAKKGQRYGLCIGWVKEPNKHTASRIIVAVGAAFIGAAAFSALTAPAAASGSGVSAAAAGAGGATAGAAVPLGIETVTVVASGTSAIGAGTVAAGLSAGAVAIAASPPPLSAPPIETVTVVGSAPAASFTAGQIGTAIIAAAPPALLTPNIETVTVEAPRVDQHPVDAATTAATGLISVGIAQPIISVNPPNPQYDNSLRDSIKEQLQDAAAEYGGEWIKEHLNEWLADRLGHEPTQTEYEQYQDFIDPTSPGALFRKFLPIIIGVLVVAAIIERARN